MKPRFDGHQYLEFGFDGDAAPAFQLVPHNDFRSLWLYDADGMEVKSIVPGIVRLEEIRSPVNNIRIFKVHGLMRGKTFVEVKDKSRLMTRLEVKVVLPMSFTISFNFVADQVNGRVLHKTKRTRSEIDDLIYYANNTIFRQTNISMIKHRIRDLTINKNLGDVFNQDSDDWYRVVSERDKTAVVNVFFVWQLKEAAGANLNRDIMIQDDLGDVRLENVLTHELGHMMGLPDENRPNKAVGFMMSSGTRIRRNEMLAMRSTLAHILKLTGK